MTNNATELALEQNYHALVKVAGQMLKTASDGSATPQDVLEVLDSVVDQLGELRQEIPGGSQNEQNPDEERQAPQENKADPANRGAKTEIDTAEDFSEKVNAQNAAQLALRNKTYSMNAKDLENKIKALTARLDEAESYKAGKEREEVADEYADIFPEHQQQAKFDEVINSEIPLETWKDRIATIQTFNQTNSVTKQARTNSIWIPTKTAKLNQSQVRFI